MYISLLHLHPLHAIDATPIPAAILPGAASKKTRESHPRLAVVTRLKLKEVL